MANVMNAELDEIATAKLAVDTQVEQRKVADALLYLQPNSNGPDVLEAQ